MRQKHSLIQSRTVSALTTIVGLALFIALAFSLNALFSSRGRQPMQIASQPQRPSVPQLLSTPTPTANQPPSTPTFATDQTDPMAGWKLVVDNELQLSFKMPPDWADFGVMEGDFAITRVVGNVSGPNLLADSSGSGVVINIKVLKKTLFTEFKDQSPRYYVAHLQRQPQGVWRHEDPRYRMRREEDLLVAGYPAVTQVVMPAEDAQIERFYSYLVYLTRDSSVYEISAITASEKVWQQQQYNLVFSQVLQSLRFLSP